MSDAEQRRAHLSISLGRGNESLYLFGLLKVSPDFRALKHEEHKQQIHVFLSTPVRVQEHHIGICSTVIQISDILK